MDNHSVPRIQHLLDHVAHVDVGACVTDLIGRDLDLNIKTFLHVVSTSKVCTNTYLSIKLACEFHACKRFHSSEVQPLRYRSVKAGVPF